MTVILPESLARLLEDAGPSLSAAAVAAIRAGVAARPNRSLGNFNGASPVKVKRDAPVVRTPGCAHPVGRRLGSMCGACGASVR